MNADLRKGLDLLREIADDYRQGRYTLGALDDMSCRYLVEKTDKPCGRCAVGAALHRTGSVTDLQMIEGGWNGSSWRRLKHVAPEIAGQLPGPDWLWARAQRAHDGTAKRYRGEPVCKRSVHVAKAIENLIAAIEANPDDPIWSLT